MAVSSTTSSTAGQTIQKANVSGSATSSAPLMNANTFMQLFTTQLANQNPMNPMSSSDFLNQFAQITSVQTMDQLQQTLQGVGNNMQSLVAVGQVTQALGMLGHTVGYVDAAGSPHQGMVQQISVNSAGAVQLNVAGNLVGLDAVSQVQ